jgi:hypothetical protein
MVMGDTMLASLLAVDEPAGPLLEQLDPPRRAVVVMAILGLVLLGITLVTCVMIGGRWVRKLARDEHGPTDITVANRRLRDTLRPILPDGDTKPGETAVIKRTSDETVAGK